MLDMLVDGIVAKLVETFGADYKIYTEQVKQGLIEPCFVVSLIVPTNGQFMGNRYYRTNLFSVQYIPRMTTDAKAECYKIQDALFEALEYIYVGDDLQRGTGMNGEFVDGTLIVLVNYNMFVYKILENDPMETLAIESDAR